MLWLRRLTIFLKQNKMGVDLSARLFACGELVPDGAYLADVGTDHAYLVISLLKRGKIRKAVCSDINEGPLGRARANVAEAQLLDRVDFCLADGAASLEKYKPDAYSVCGMGGELIAEIISKAPAMKSEGVSLVLQPMTRPEALRELLASQGFRIKEERYVLDAGRYYAVISASYDGVVREISKAELYFGELPKKGEHVTEERLGYIRQRAGALAKMIDGKRRGGESSEAESELLASVSEYI